MPPLPVSTLVLSALVFLVGAVEYTGTCGSNLTSSSNCNECSGEFPCSDLPGSVAVCGVGSVDGDVFTCDACCGSSSNDGCVIGNKYDCLASEWILQQPLPPPPPELTVVTQFSDSLCLSPVFLLATLADASVPCVPANC
jgi:hypothetical protein